MKKLTALLLLVSLLFCAAVVPVSAAPESEFASIAVGSPLFGTDGAELGAAYVDQNARTLVPLRALANLLGLQVSWDGATSKASFQKGNTAVAFVQGSSAYYLNGEEKTMDTAVVNKNGRVYAPARYLAEAFGYTVGWDGATRTVTFSVNNATVSFQVKNGSVKAADISHKTYKYSSSYSAYDVIVITNNSNYSCELSLEATYYKDGKPVDLATSSITVFAPHTSVAVYNMPDYEYDTVSYQYTLSEASKYYHATTQNLTYDYNVADKNVIGSVTNNGTMAAKFVEVTVLFFKDGQLVDTDWTYAVGSQSEIAAGMKESFKCSSYSEFDSVEVYLDSRGTNY